LYITIIVVFLTAFSIRVSLLNYIPYFIVYFLTVDAIDILGSKGHTASNVRPP